MVFEIGLQLISNSVTDPGELLMIASWRKQYEDAQRTSLRRAVVLTAVSEGYDTVKEIVAQTGISDASVRRILEKLFRQKQIVRTLIKAREQGSSGLQYRFSID